MSPASDSPLPSAVCPAEGGDGELPADRIKIPPPVPAPYLEGVPPLDDALLGAMAWRKQLSPALDLELALAIREVADAIRRRRRNFENVHRVVIESERPYAP